MSDLKAQRAFQMLDAQYLAGVYMALAQQASGIGAVGIKSAAMSLHTWILSQGVLFACDKAKKHRKAALAMLEMEQAKGDPELLNYLQERATTFGDFIDQVVHAHPQEASDSGTTGING